MFRLLQLSIILLITAQYAGAQTTLLVPSTFLLAKERLPLLNPAWSDTSRVSAVSGHRQYTGPASKVSTSYFLGGLRLGRDGRRHSLSAGLQTTNTGPYLANRALHIIYSYTLVTGPETFIAAGGSVGLQGYYFDGPSATGAASSTMPDLNAGLRFGYRSFSIGASVNQIPDRVFSPRYAAFQYPRYLLLNYKWQKDLSPDLTLQHIFIYRMAPSPHATAQLMADLTYRNLFTAGAGYERVAGIYLYMDMGFHINSRNRMSFGAAYNTGTAGTGTIKLNTIEFNIRLVKS